MTKAKVNDWARNRLNSIEQRPKMWGTPETIEAAYLEVLGFALHVDGNKRPDPTVAEAYRATQKRIYPMMNPQVRAYSVGFTRDEDGDRVYTEATFAELVKFLQAVREELGYAEKTK